VVSELPASIFVRLALISGLVQSRKQVGNDSAGVDFRHALSEAYEMAEPR
jgi:hypothetical protein